MSGSPRFIDLFAGCGGMSHGLRCAGLRPVAEVEQDAWACETLRHNFDGSEVVEADLSEVSDSDISQFRGVDVVVGGPPCQGFSVAGGRQYGVDDPRNKLFRSFLRWVCIIQPRVMMLENVPGILTKVNGEGQTVVECLRAALGPLGYSVKHRVLNAADFGVPQLRRRAFVVATATGLEFEWPVAGYAPTGGLDLPLFRPAPKAAVTVDEALCDLPRLAAGEGQDCLVPYPEGAVTAPYQAAMRANSPGIANHIAMRHTTRLVERFGQIGHGQSLKDVVGAHRQVRKRSGEFTDKPFKSNNYRLDPRKPSLAIPASFQSLFLHPYDNRNLTAREAARLMSFPDTFVFKGKRTTMSWEKHLSQYNQIGNAVCPLLGAALGESIRAALGARDGGYRPTSSRKPVEIVPVRAPTPSAPALVEGEEPYREVARLSRDLLERHALLCEDGVKREGFPIPAVAVGLALLLSTEPDCPICRGDLPPRAQHGGTMAYLISKEDIASLPLRNKDHGLDYHLREVLGISHQCGHFVGESLASMGLANDTVVVNVRTGRKVRGIDGVICPPEFEAIRGRVMEVLRASLRKAVCTVRGMQCPSTHCSVVNEGSPSRCSLEKPRNRTCGLASKILEVTLRRQRDE